MALSAAAGRLLARPLSKAGALAPRPGWAALTTGRPAAKGPHIQGEELMGEEIDVDKAFPHEEHRRSEEPVVVNLEREHGRVEDQEVPSLSSLLEPHRAVDPGQAMSAEEAAAEVERLRREAPPVQGAPF